MMFRGKKGFVPAIMAGVRIAATAGRGIASGARTAGRGIKRGADWGNEGISNHPNFQRFANHRFTQGAVNNRFTQAAVNNRVVNNPATRVIGGAAGLMGGLALAGGRGSAKVYNNVNKAELKTVGNFIAGFALVLWIIDILPIPFLGDVYKGFNFNPQDFWDNWLSNFTLGNVWFDTLITLVAIFIIIKYAKERKFPNGIDLFSIILFSFTIIFFIANPGWIVLPKAILHFIFIILFGFMYIGRLTNANMAFIIVSGLLFFDFFLFSTVLNAVPVLKYISLLSTIVIALTFGFTPSGFTGTIASLLVVFVVVISVAEGVAGSVFFEEGEGDRPTASEVVDRLRTGFGKYRDQIQDALSARIQYAITGKVEENQFEPLGVYLDNVQSTAKKYYIDKEGGVDKFEEVIIYGTVRGRTLDDPINIKVGCFAGKDKEPAKKIDPAEKFTIFTLEEQDFACTFTEEQLEDGKILKKGSNRVTTFADFNFETLAYQKIYFIDRERLRAMVREGLDVFDEFGIKDKKPVPVYTNGPVAIEMGTSSPIVGVSNNYIAFPRFSLSIKNRPEWQGRITGLSELVLLLPKGVKIDNPGIKVEREADGRIKKDADGNDIEEETDNDCNVRFREYNLADCQASCGTFVLNECNEVCTGYVESREKTSCEAYCVDERDQCEKQCQFLFNEDDQEYEGYALAQSAIKKLQKRVYDDDDAGRFERFNCKLNPIRDEVLGNSPITTKFFRIKVRYNYTVESPVTIQIVEALPIEGVDPTPVDPVSGGVALTEAEILLRLGQPDADGIYEYEAPGATPIWYRYYITDTWEWTPYDPSSTLDCWMPVAETTVSNSCGGSFDGKQPVQANIDIINFLNINNPTPEPTPTVVATITNRLGEIAIDNTHIFVKHYNNLEGIISKVDKNGGEVTNVVTFSGTGSGLTPIAVDDTRVYFNSGGNIKRVNKNTGTLATLAAGGDRGVSDLYIDNDNVYWTNFDNVNSVPKIGGTAITLASGNFVTDIAVDDTYVYFIDSDNDADSIKRVPKSGGTVETIHTRGTSVGDVLGDLAADSSGVYWTETIGRLKRIPNGELAIEDLASEGGYEIILDADNIYLIQANAIKMVPKTGGTPVTLATIDGTTIGDIPTGIAVDNTNVYWLEPTPRQVKKIQKS